MSTAISHISASRLSKASPPLRRWGKPVRERLIETLDRVGEASVGELATAVDVRWGALAGR
jgi:hypothetical protein